MTRESGQPQRHFEFARNWEAQILENRPAILPARHYVFPQDAEEVERGALEVMVRPATVGIQPFLATCALGFRDPAVPTGLWSAPNADELCAVSGGYAYLINVTAPEHFHMLPYRPVLEVRPVLEKDLLLFVGHRTVLAWGPQGQAWESAKISDEGLTITAIEQGTLRGLGWNLMTDRETPFELDLRDGSLLR